MHLRRPKRTRQINIRCICVCDAANSYPMGIQSRAVWLALGVIAGLLFVAVSVCCAWLAAARSALVADRDRLQQELVESNQKVQEGQSQVRLLEQSVAESDRNLAVAQQSHHHFQEQFDKAQQQLRDAFKSLAGDALEQSSKQLLAWAKKSFESEQIEVTSQLEQRRQAIDALVNPLKASLDKYNVFVQQIESTRKEAYGELKQQVASMIDDQRRLHKETAGLVAALRRPEVRGRWGEMQLKRVVELAGMIENCDFTEQVSVDGPDGVVRPDMTVHLPSDRTIVVDAKTPLDAFISAIECSDDQDRAGFLEKHADQIETQVRALSAKRYAAQFARSPDLVVLFIPGESFLQAAVQLRPGLIEDAMVKGVVIATPTTLIVLLKAVAMGWREQRFTENARQLSELAKGLHGRLATALGHLGNLGKAMNTTVAHYNRLVGSLESNVLPQMQRFKDFGADSHKQLPTGLDRVDVAPRELVIKVKAPSQMHGDPPSDVSHEPRS